MAVPDAVEQLVGVQAQTPHSWYVGLWSRLVGFVPADTSDLLANRMLVRIALMRSTLHLVTVRDAAALRSLLQPVLDRDLFTNQLHRDAIRGVDPVTLVERARVHLRDGPLTAKQLGVMLQHDWPDRPAATLAYAARNLLPLVQVPPRALWGRSGPIAHSPLDDWSAGASLAVADHEPVEDFTVERLVTRYLGAFGPATVMDVQKWSGLTRLGEVVERLRHTLITFRDEDGRELFDLPAAPRPDPDTPAPVRLLYDFDNLLLSHVDRSRVVTDDFMRFSWRPNGPVPSPILIDGSTAGDWSRHPEGERRHPHPAYLSAADPRHRGGAARRGHRTARRAGGERRSPQCGVVDGVRPPLTRPYLHQGSAGSHGSRRRPNLSPPALQACGCWPQ